MNNPKCLIVRGPAGVGKTTIAKKLIDDYDSPAEYLNCDQLRRELYSEDKWQKECKIEIVEEIAKRAKQFLAEGKKVIIDDIIEYPEQVEILNKELPDAQWITLDATLETLFDRDQSRQGREDNQSFIGQKAIEFLYKHFLRQPVEGEITINTENKNPDQIYQELKTMLK